MTPLPHAAGKLVRVGIQSLFRVRELDLFQEVAGMCERLLPIHSKVSGMGPPRSATRSSWTD